MARTKPSLAALGLDVLVSITSFLRPPDIISLRLVSGIFFLDSFSMF